MDFKSSGCPSDWTPADALAVSGVGEHPHRPRPAAKRGHGGGAGALARSATPGREAAVQKDTSCASTAGNKVYADSRDWLAAAHEMEKTGYLWAGMSNRVRECGTIPVLKSKEVALGITPAGGVQCSGLGRCGSRWCPDCWGKIARYREQQVTKVLDWAIGEGYRVAMVTLTAAHVRDETVVDAKRRGVNPVTIESVKKVFDLLKKAWRRVHSGRAGKKLSDERIGYLRSAEVTVDDLTQTVAMTGAHLHFHTIVIVEGSRDRCATHCNEMTTRWVKACQKVGLDAADAGQDVKLLNERVDAKHTANPAWMAEYVTKGEKMSEIYIGTVGAAQEMTLGHSKLCRERRRCSPEQLLRYVGQLRDCALRDRLTAQWRGIEEATWGTRWLTTSRGLYDLAGVNDVDDEEVARKEVAVADDRVAVAVWDDVEPVLPEIRDVVDMHRMVQVKLGKGTAEMPFDTEALFAAMVGVLDDHMIPYDVQQQSEFQVGVEKAREEETERQKAEVEWKTAEEPGGEGEQLTLFSPRGPWWSMCRSVADVVKTARARLGRSK